MARKRRKRQIRRRGNPEGRKSKFTRAHRKIIYRALEGRLPLTRACELAGISFVTFRNWMKAGRDEENIIYFRFRSIVKGIQARNEMDALEVIHKAQRGLIPIRETKVIETPNGDKTITRTRKVVPQYQAAIWYLERIARGTYGKNAILDEMPTVKTEQKISVSGKVIHDHDHKHNHIVRSQIDSLKQLSREDLEKLIRILRSVESTNANASGVQPAIIAGGGNGAGREVASTVH